MTNEFILELKDWSVIYPPCIKALKKISVSISPHTGVSVIGSPGAGKSTLLRSINRLHELNPAIKTSGEILLNGQNILTLPVMEVRRKIGMIFRSPTIFPNMNIRDNVVAGYTLNHIALSKKEKEKLTEEYLREVDLWEEVKNDLHRNPAFLSPGQQQCICIARTLALRPEVLLMDEPNFALDILYAGKIEKLVARLKGKITLLVATYNLTQTARMADYTLYLEEGELVEYDVTSNIFWMPADKRTERYITNRT
jgi:phosphate transport system ATP-binding protein